MVTQGKVVSAQTPLAKARELFRRETGCFGPQEVAKLGWEPDKIPLIPLSETMLLHLKTLGVSLELHGPITMKELHDGLGNKLGDGKLLYKVDYAEEPFYTEEKAPDWHWRVTTRNLIPDSTGKKYVPQTRVLAEYLQNQVFAGQTLPLKFQQVLEELNDRERELEELVESDWQAGAEQAANLAINQSCRQMAVQALWDVALHEEENYEYLLPDALEWSKSRSSDGALVDVGYADSGGVRVGYDRSSCADPNRGARFSCRAEDLAG